MLVGAALRCREPVAAKLIDEGLCNGNFLRQPQFTVSLMPAYSHQANALGQVSRAMRFPMEQAGVRLTDLLATGRRAGRGAPTGGRHGT